MLTPQQARQRLRRVSSLSIDFSNCLDNLLNDLLVEGKHFLAVDNISVWLFDDLDNPTHLNCIAHTSFNENTKGREKLIISEFPSYFLSVLQGETIAAKSVIVDPRTTELARTNGEIQSFRAILDTVIYHNGKPHGVVSCESFNRNHIWVEDDITYAESLADSCSRRLMARETLKLQKQMSELVYVDTLTGLKNRRYFNERVQSAKSSQYRQQTPLSLVMIDLDHFKHINDDFGHEAGDRVLIEFSKTCSRLLRLEDCFCRYGGEEFILILPHTTKKQALKLSERLRVATEKMNVVYEGANIQCTASFGICEMQINQSIEETIKLADKAVYQAKSNGRNRVETH